MKPTPPYLICLMIFIGMWSCGKIQDQKKYLAGLKKVESSEQINLLSDFEIFPQSGEIGVLAYSIAGQGKYDKVLESDSGSFFLAFHPDFLVDDAEVGGLFLSRDKVYLWSSTHEGPEKFFREIRDTEFVKGLSLFTHPERIFIHTEYIIQTGDYEII